MGPDRGSWHAWHLRGWTRCWPSLVCLNRAQEAVDDDAAVGGCHRAVSRDAASRPHPRRGGLRSGECPLGFLFVRVAVGARRRPVRPGRLYPSAASALLASLPSLYVALCSAAAGRCLPHASACQNVNGLRESERQRASCCIDIANSESCSWSPGSCRKKRGRKK